MLEAVVRENYKMSAPGMTGILVCAIRYLKKVAVSESREITRVAYMLQITNIEAVSHENYKRSAPGRAEILACAIGRMKEAAVSESREITR